MFEVNKRIAFYAILFVVGFILGYAYFSVFFAYDIEKEKLMLIEKGIYKCCLEKPCNYCYFEEKKCFCLEDVVNGNAPCGECIGEILEGNGNKMLKQYFAASLSDVLGKDLQEKIEKIINEKYGQQQ